MSAATFGPVMHSNRERATRLGSRPRSGVAHRSAATTFVVVALTVMVAAGCGDDPAAPGADVFTDVTHLIEPTEQMRLAAEQQCLDDPDLVSGYVAAVAPETEEVLAEISVDCSEVR